MPVVYTAVNRFDPTLGEKWQSYIDWSGLTLLREVISLDGLLCSSIFQELIDEDWNYNVKEDFKTDLFFNLDHVLKRVAGNERVNVLALIENPTADEIKSFADPRFVFRGFDIVDVHGDISALVNCGGFDKTFSNDELSEFGLITDYRRAFAIQQSLPTDYPNEPHAECNTWAIWQMVR